MIHIKKGLTTDVNKYIEFYAQNQYDPSMLKEYKDAVNGIISKDFAINIDSEELDPYLLFLINNNSFFAIKKYIGIRDCTNYNKFLVSNDILNKTCLVLFEGIKNTYIAQGFSESLFKSRKVFEYLTDDTCIFEREPLERLAKDGELKSYVHHGFWQCMDNMREHDILERLYAENRAPWKVW